ncbi:kinase-like domain-containing protein [Pelagophyceae sp. CCMP2097]|nr:kinase-like domain-containing protein [Pelagophyceae sp. CCMP2097]
MADFVGPPGPSKAERVRKWAALRARILNVARAARAQPDVWAEHSIDLLPAERVRRHRYHAETGEWALDDSLVKVESSHFDEGAMRRCYRAKKEAFGYVKRYHALDWRGAANYVLKEYKRAESDPKGRDDRAFDDVRVQTESSHYAELFNRLRPPKQIKMIDCFVLEFVDRPGSPVLCAERYIDGHDTFGRGFVKHNNNSGFTDCTEHRSTPQAFSAQSFYASQGDALVCDIQGVEDLYTDPQLHTAALTHGDGDLGFRGMALFFATCDSRENPLFSALDIPHFPLTSLEHRRCVCALEAATKGESPSVRWDATSFSTTPMRECDRKKRDMHAEATAHRKEKRKSVVSNDAVTLPLTREAAATVFAEARGALRAAFAAAAAAPEALSPAEKLDGALAQVHGALARLQCEGRWTANAPDAASALFHAALAADLGCDKAAFALARWHQNLTHPILPSSRDNALDLAQPRPDADDGPAPDCDGSTRDARHAGAFLHLAAARGHRAAAAALGLALLDGGTAAALGLAPSVDRAAALLQACIFRPMLEPTPDLPPDGGAATAPGPQAVPAFGVGDAISCDYGGEGTYYPATIRAA